jgi:hypothetical protein
MSDTQQLVAARESASVAPKDRPPANDQRARPDSEVGEERVLRLHIVLREGNLPLVRHGLVHGRRSHTRRPGQHTEGCGAST